MLWVHPLQMPSVPQPTTHQSFSNTVNSIMKYFIIYTHHPISIKGRKSLNIHLDKNPSNKTIKHLLKLEMPYFKTTHWSLSWPFRKLLGLKVRVHYFNHDVCLQINFLTWGPFYYLLRRNFSCARSKKLFRDFICLVGPNYLSFQRQVLRA